MPRMDGYRLCHEIRMNERLHDLPFILYTSSFTSPGDEKPALDVGADKYLKKPCSLETIVAALHEVIAQFHVAPRAEAPGEVEVLKEYSGQLVNKLEERNAGLMATEVKFCSLVEQSIVGIYMVQDDQIVYVNPRMAGIFGWSEEEMTSRTVYDFIVPEDHALVRENMRNRISGAVASSHYYLRMLHQSGAVLQVELYASRMDHNGRPAVMGTLLDITERKAPEIRIRHLNRLFATQSGISALIARARLRRTVQGGVPDRGRGGCIQYGVDWHDRPGHPDGPGRRQFWRSRRRISARYRNLDGYRHPARARSDGYRYPREPASLDSGFPAKPAHRTVARA
jgi:PAS domain S-box-containing protein